MVLSTSLSKVPRSLPRRGHRNFRDLIDTGSDIVMSCGSAAIPATTARILVALEFSSISLIPAAHQLSMDKWRNLLRASGAQKRKSNKKEVEEKLKDVVRSLPSCVVRRVRELASIHPYPRFSPGGRYIRRKKN